MTPPDAAPNASVRVFPADDARWFRDEVQPHEPALRNFLRQRYPTFHDCDDLIQESYARILKAHSKGPVTNVKSFLFTTARNAAVDLFRRKTASRTESLADLELLPVQEERASGPEAISRNQELECLEDALAALPERCRLILTLRKIEGLPRAAIAQKLGIAENTVNAQIQIGMLKVQQYFIDRGLYPRTRP